MDELKAWLVDNGFTLVSEDILDFGVLLVLQPPLGRTMNVTFRPELPPETVIDMVQHMYQYRLDTLYRGRSGV